MSLPIKLAVALLLLANPEAIRLAQEASALAQAGELTPALAKMERAATVAPADPNIAYNLAQLREATGKREEAAKAYERYLKLAPSAPDAAAVSAKIAALRQALAPPSQEAQDLLVRGQAYFKMERFFDAEAAFRKASELAPGWGPPLFNRGVALESLKRWGEAAEAFRAYRLTGPNDDMTALTERIALNEIRSEDDRGRIDGGSSAARAASGRATTPVAAAPLPTPAPTAAPAPGGAPVDAGVRAEPGKSTPASQDAEIERERARATIEAERERARVAAEAERERLRLQLESPD